MNFAKFLGLAKGDTTGGVAASAPLGGTRSEAIQRLQVGAAGIGAMLLLVALANVIQNRARVTDELSVPAAAPTTEPSKAAPANDPLADAGIVPDIPVEPQAQQPQQKVPGEDATRAGGTSGGTVEDLAPDKSE